MGGSMKTIDVPIGAKVRFHFAGRQIEGRILQDRGPIGRGGRHLYMVQYELGKGNLYTTELPREELENIGHKPTNTRKRREVDYIIPVEAVEAHSLFAKPKHAQLLAAFLHKQGVRYSVDSEAIQGEINFQIDKFTPWDEFVVLLNDWKQMYAEGSD